MSASTNAADAIDKFLPRTEVTEPLCADCGHGALAHSLMGMGTCSVTAVSWHQRVRESCDCVRFRFPQVA